MEAARPIQRRVIIPTLGVSLVTLLMVLALEVWLASPGLYLTALAVLLFQSGFLFSLIVFSFLPQAAAAGGPGDAD